MACCYIRRDIKNFIHSFIHITSDSGPGGPISRGASYRGGPHIALTPVFFEEGVTFAFLWSSGIRENDLRKFMTCIHVRVTVPTNLSMKYITATVAIPRRQLPNSKGLLFSWVSLLLSPCLVWREPASHFISDTGPHAANITS